MDDIRFTCLFSGSKREITLCFGSNIFTKKNYFVIKLYNSNYLYFLYYRYSVQAGTFTGAC
ncbi:hypothetical protein APS_2094 [Acetobacter pasteurianus subsp. pasteurianus LMG 1262 = NBRC 106471]|nr:hypothetical protein APS_2094 [Acetobacter pasteurianus subsp. pasteurianus LMG 1262 = NBRC 106471]